MVYKLHLVQDWKTLCGLSPGTCVITYDVTDFLSDKNKCRKCHQLIIKLLNIQDNGND